MALEPCERCNGIGVIKWIEYVTRDMARDACEPDMEGQPIEQTSACPDCNGYGFVDLDPEPGSE